MDALEGIWRLVECRGWDEAGNPLPSPYGSSPMGQIMFSKGRMISALCNGDAGADGVARSYSSYGGPYTFDGRTLEVSVDIASDPTRIGGKQMRRVVMTDERHALLLPPEREYAGVGRQRRELLWERIWRPE